MAKQADGRYRAKVTVGHDTDGLPIVKYASGKTKKELEAKKAELRRHYVTGEADIKRDVLFDVYALEWYQVYKEPKIRPNTRVNYEAALSKHLLPVLGGRQLRAISAVELQQLMNSKEGMGRTTIGDAFSILRHVFRRATAAGIIDRDPTLGLTKPTAQTEERRALTDAEDAAVRMIIKTHLHGLMLAILYYTGVRRGEALALRWSDLNYADRMIHIERDIDFSTNDVGEVKSARSVRDVPMPDELFEMLNKVRGIGDNYIILSPRTHSFLGVTTYTRWWEELMESLYESDSTIESIEGRSILTAHYFRHNYASVLYNAGVDVLTAQRFLGHADAKTTLAIYTHLAGEKEKKGAAKVNAAFKKVAGKLPAKNTTDRNPKTKNPTR